MHYFQIFYCRFSINIIWPANLCSMSRQGIFLTKIIPMLKKFCVKNENEKLSLSCFSLFWWNRCTNQPRQSILLKVKRFKSNTWLLCSQRIAVHYKSWKYENFRIIALTFSFDAWRSFHNLPTGALSFFGHTLMVICDTTWKNGKGLGGWNSQQCWDWGQIFIYLSTT